MLSRAPEPVIVAANRGPYTFRDGIWQRGDGGLVSALRHLVDWVPATWISTQTVPAPHPPFPPLGRFPLSHQSVIVDPVTYRAYYDLIANHLLWFVQHQLADPPQFDPSWWRHWSRYCQTNLRFAERIAREAAGHPRLVMVHDYHLYMVPWLLRRMAPHLAIEHFTHIPWPPLSAWQALPDGVVRRLLKGMLASDIVGFNAARYVARFLAACQHYLELPVDWEQQRVGPCQITHYPVSVDLQDLRRSAASAAVAREAHQLPPGDGPLIVQIGRTDPSKNLLTGLRAFMQVADQHPTCRYLGLFQPSRQSHPVYQAHLTAIRQLAMQLQARWGDRVQVVFDNRLPLALAALKQYDVLLINSLADGMNLIAKEGPAVNERNGVLILTPQTGAYEELGHACLTLDPADLPTTTRTLMTALALPQSVKRRMWANQQQVLQRHSVHHWISQQLGDLQDVVERRITRAA